jgi:hypothetical protein
MASMLRSALRQPVRTLVGARRPFTSGTVEGFVGALGNTPLVRNPFSFVQLKSNLTYLLYRYT